MTSLEDPLKAIGKTVAGYTIKEFKGKGNIGYVYKVVRDDIHDVLACKLIPSDRVRPSWQVEIEKAVLLKGIGRIIEYRGHGDVEIGSRKYKYILSDYVDGPDLRLFEMEYRESINLSFVEALLKQTLEVFLALEVTGNNHGDLHEGNIMIAPPDPRKMILETSFKLGDFGIGNSVTDFKPKDDYHQLARICTRLLADYIDPAQLEGEDRFFYDQLIGDFIPKRLLEKDPTVGDFVGSARKLNDILNRYRTEFPEKMRQEKLKYPFDFLSCEQFGDSFELLQKLYSHSFPGYDTLLQKTNTILTGPRGCGKTTIFRNLSLKARLLAKQADLRQLDGYAGVYYHCTDLFFAFPYLRDKQIDDGTGKILVHYFNLSLLHELLDTLRIAQQHLPEGKLSRRCLLELQRFLGENLPKLIFANADADILHNCMSTVESERRRVKAWSERGELRPEVLLPLDFLGTLCSLLQREVPWLVKRPIYFFLDDYSKPKVSEGVQSVLNDIIFHRYSQCFFKVATESTTSFHARDSRGKLLEETREYDLVDLGAYFMGAKREELTEFLGEVINNRLENSETVPPEHYPISTILGETDYTYGELATQIRAGEHVRYKGWPLICELCSGDVANILHAVRDMFADAGYTFERLSEAPIHADVQDKAIRVTASNFLNTIQSVPRDGPLLRRIAEAFGHVSNHYLRTRSSKNEERFPPFQAFRLELLDNPKFEGQSRIKEVYDDLIKYAVFVLDLRGKSQRGDVVPRLYLRRLLLPAFLLTPNRRDSVRIESAELVLLLNDPEEFEAKMMKKVPRESVRARSPLSKEQVTLDS
jgi:serine/threonine protein kinase